MIKIGTRVLYECKIPNCPERHLGGDLGTVVAFEDGKPRIRWDREHNGFETMENEIPHIADTTWAWTAYSITVVEP